MYEIQTRVGNLRVRREYATGGARESGSFEINMYRRLNLPDGSLVIEKRQGREWILVTDEQEIREALGYILDIQAHIVQP
jgi:hypothetical protein